MIRLSFYNPSGTTDITQSHAPRIDSLNGKNIGFLSNDQWQAYRTLPLIRDMIQKDFPDCTVLPIDALPQGVGAIGSRKTVEKVKAAQVDAVVIGNAA